MNRAKGINRLFLAMVLISIGSPFLIGFIFTELTFYQSASLSELIFLVPVLIYLIFTRGEILNDLQLQIPKISVLLLTVAMSWLLLPVMSWLNLFSMLFAENYVSSSMAELQGASVGRNLMYVALVPALAEEFMFRGVFFHGYRPAGVWKAALLSGFCFGLIHMNLNQFFYAFVLGVIFALLVEATGSLITSMLAHFVINSNSVFMLVLLQRMEEMGYYTESTQAASEAVTRSEIVSALGIYTVLAVVCGLTAWGVLKGIARLSGRSEHMKHLRGYDMWVEQNQGTCREPESDTYYRMPEDDQAGTWKWNFNGGWLQRELRDSLDDRSGWQIDDAAEDQTDSETDTDSLGRIWPGSEDTAGFWSKLGEESPERRRRKQAIRNFKSKVRLITPCLIFGIVASVAYMLILEFLPLA